MNSVETLRYEEMAELPTFKEGLDRLLNRKKYDFILTAQSIEREALTGFVEKAIGEGNAVLIQREWNGYMVVVWRD